MAELVTPDLIFKDMHPYLGEQLQFLTITLPPRLYKFQSITQYELTKNEITTLLSRLCVVAWCGVELTREGNVHYHVIAVLHTKAFLIQLLNKFKRSKTFGFVKVSPSISTEDSLKRATIYLFKDVSTSKQVLHTSSYKPELIFRVDHQ